MRHLQELRKELETIAKECGCPEKNERASIAVFDARTSTLFAQLQLLQNGDALRDDVWLYLSGSLLFHLSHWRFGGSPERFRGGALNTFQRLWLRGHLFDRGGRIPQSERWEVLQNLTEDAMVAIIERPSLAADQIFRLPWQKGGFDAPPRSVPRRWSRLCARQL